MATNQDKLNWMVSKKFVPSRILTIYDLPSDLFNEVLDKLEPIERLPLRKVSQIFRTAIDNRNHGFKEIAIGIYDYFERYSTLRLDEKLIEYRKDYDDCTVKLGSRKCTVLNENFEILALKDFFEVLKSKTELELVQINLNVNVTKKDFRTESFINLLSTLESLKPVKAKCVIFELHPSEVAMVLPYFEELELIEIFSSQARYKLDELIHLEQWKMAKRFKGVSYCDAFSIPVENLLHFEHFDVQLSTFTVGDALKIRNGLQNSGNFKSGRFRCQKLNRTEIAKIFKPDYAGEILLEYEVNNEMFIIDISYGSWNIKKNNF